MSRSTPSGTGERLRLTRKEHGLVVEAGGHHSFVFDEAGRLLDAVLEGVVFRRGMDNRVLRISAERRTILTPKEGGPLVEKAYETIRRLAETAGPRTKEGLAAVLSCTPEVLLEQERRFGEIYKTIPILPPDQNHSIYLQATLGCPTNRCSFCTFYRDRTFRVRPLDEFRRHAEEVRQLLGPDAGRRKTIFLGEANALAIPAADLRAIVGAAIEVFPKREIFAFADAATHRHRTPDELLGLRDLGLRRLTLGVETGHLPLYDRLQKPGSLNDAEETIRRIKSAGLHLGLSILAGLGGRTHEKAHVDDTLKFILRQPLGPGDYVYLSPVVVDPKSDVAEWTREDPALALSSDETHRQLDRMHAGLQEPLRSIGVRVATYDISRFIY